MKYKIILISFLIFISSGMYSQIILTEKKEVLATDTLDVICSKGIRDDNVIIKIPSGEIAFSKITTDSIWKSYMDEIETVLKAKNSEYRSASFQNLKSHYVNFVGETKWIKEIKYLNSIPPSEYDKEIDLQGMIGYLVCQMCESGHFKISLDNGESIECILKMEIHGPYYIAEGFVIPDTDIILNCWTKIQF